MQRFHKASLLAGTIMAGAVFAAPAYAQTETVSGSAEETTESTAIVVTGSRIQRTDLQSTSPVAVVSAEEFRLTGAVNVEQVLNTLPQVLPGVTGFSNNPGNGNGDASTCATLAPPARWCWSMAAAGCSPTPTRWSTCNTIPQFLLSDVDVLTGGASAVYGTDAVCRCHQLQPARQSKALNWTAPTR